MSNSYPEKVLDGEGLSTLWTIIKNYVANNTDKRISVDAVANLTQAQLNALRIGDLVVTNSNPQKAFIVAHLTTTAIRLINVDKQTQYDDSVVITAYRFTKTDDTWGTAAVESFALQRLIDGGHKVSADNIANGSTNKILTFTEYQNLINMAQGATKSYTISDAAATGYVNAIFNNSSNNIILESGTKIIDSTPNTPKEINYSDLKMGDIINVIEGSVPDRWVGPEYYDNLLEKNCRVLYYYEARTITDATPTYNSTNPVQSGGVYNALENKWSKTEVLSDEEIEAICS